MDLTEVVDQCEQPPLYIHFQFDPYREAVHAPVHTDVGKHRLDIVDGTRVGFGHQLLMVSLAYRRRAIPIAWSWVRHVRVYSSAVKQICPPAGLLLLQLRCEFIADLKIA